MGYRPLYLLAYQDGQLLGGAQLLLRGLPLVGTVAYLPYGPLITHGPGRDTARVALCEALRGLRRRGVRALLVQPPPGAEDVSDELFELGFRESDVGIAPTATLRIGLDRDEAELRARLSRRLRTWTRQWESRGVRVRIGGPADIAALAELSARTAAYQGFTSFPASYLRLLYEVLEPGGRAVLLVAEIGGRPVAAELFTGCGGVLKSRITGLDREHPEVARLHTSAAVIWAAIRWARVRGYDWFDFGGLHQDTATRFAVRRTLRPHEPARAGPVQARLRRPDLPLPAGGRAHHARAGAARLRPRPPQPPRSTPGRPRQDRAAQRATHNTPHSHRAVTGALTSTVICRPAATLALVPPRSRPARGPGCSG
ncbi:hypothetical protein GCM10023321_44930 [Pseudonocardia eucalypti]|uniref:BioF2-like acetyltransferase domain-containing protein n=1 Tax=Pseudonocardia eucalypti TaxID=648755 RepID=A0ABP9QFN2_9PSEU